MLTDFLTREPATLTTADDEPARLVSICIATYHRPALLEKLLVSLREIEVPPRCTIELRVIDNDAARSGREVVKAFMADSASPRVRYEVEPVQGIANARNRALDMGPSDLVAFVDDDEVASRSWLVELVATLDRERADAVFGPVLGRCPRSAPSWMARGGFFDKRVGPDGGELEWNQTRNGNVLVRGEWFFVEGLRYSPRYGRSGGEDTELFARMALRGARYHASERAVVSEHVSAERARFRWLWRSRWLRTSAYQRVLADRSPRFVALKLLLSSAMRVSRAMLLSLVGVPPLLAGRPEYFYSGVLRWAGALAGLEYCFTPSRSAGHIAYGSQETEIVHNRPTS